MITRENYYDVGSKYDVIMSHSALSALNPDEGGSFKRLDIFFDKEIENKETLSMERGKLFHKYMEHGDDFNVMTIEKPGGMVGDICDILITVGKSLQYNNMSQFLMSEILQVANEIGYGKTWNPQTVYNKIVEGGFQYVNESLNNVDKIGITASMKTTLDNCYNSIKGLDLGYGGTEINEMALMGEINGIRFKGLLDKVHFFSEIDAVIIDYKTMAVPINSYMYSARPRHTDNGKLEYEIMGGTFLKYRTYRQLAIYRELLAQHMEATNPEFSRDNYNIRCLIVGVEISEPFESRIFEIPISHLDFGLEEVNDLTEIVGSYINWREEEGYAQESRDNRASE